jgi:hypothetical protein
MFLLPLLLPLPLLPGGETSVAESVVARLSPLLA